MTAREVVITGIGLATPLGADLAQFSQALLHGDAPFVAHPTRFTGAIPVARVSESVDVGLSRAETSTLDRSARLALLAGSRAAADAGLPPGDPLWQGAAVYVGNGSGPTHAVNDAYASLHETGRIHGLTLLRCLPGGSAASLAMRLGAQGDSRTYTVACASASIALGEALRAIRHGYVDRVMVGGTEAPLGDGTLKAWDALRVLAPCADAPGAACRPFDSSRQGLVLGEGAAFFVLEAAETALARGARVHARLAGFGSSCDAHHWTEPLKAGQLAAMRAALADAGMAPSAIGAVNAHGTGTPVGDRVEAESLSELFAGLATPVSSTKSIHGHLLGASGAIELAAAIATLHTGLVPHTRQLNDPEPAPGLHWVAGQPTPLRHGQAVLSNSFAFGGSNACLVVTLD